MRSGGVNNDLLYHVENFTFNEISTEETDRAQFILNSVR